MSRRDRALLIGALGLACWPAAVAQITPGERARMHTEGAATGAIVESAEAMKVTSVIQCFCGGCVNQTIHDCTCGMAAMERRNVAAALSEGRTPDQIIATYIAEHGPQVRVVPTRTGLHLIGWAVPYVAFSASLLALGFVLRTWQRRGAAARPAGLAPAGGLPPPESDRPYRERLEQELREMDR